MAGMENKTKMINVLHFDDGSTASAPVRASYQAPAHSRIASNWGEMMRRNITSG